MLGFAEVLELARRERKERLVSDASRNMRCAAEKNDRNLLAHRDMKPAMQRPALVRPLHLRDPLLDVMMYCHVLLFLRISECSRASYDDDASSATQPRAVRDDGVDHGRSKRREPCDPGGRPCARSSGAH